MISLVASSVLVWNASQAAFTAATDNAGNTIGSGTVILGDNDAGSAMFTMTNAKPGDSQTKCVNVSYTGTLGAQVRLQAASLGALAPYLQLTVTRGTFSSVPGSGLCTNFTGDSANYAGNGAGVIYNGLLSAFPQTWAAGLVDPSTTTSPTAEVWTTNENHAYQLTVTLNDDNNAQGKSSTPTFTWEARDATTGPGSYYANAVLADGPVGYWRLDETAGTTAADLGSGNNAGAFWGTPTLGRPGAAEGTGTSYDFGGNSCIGVGDVHDFAGTISFTAEGWVRMSPGFENSYYHLFDKRRFVDDINQGGWIVSVIPDSASTLR